MKIGDEDYLGLHTIAFVSVALKVYRLKFKHSPLTSN